jgi:hypothetical protein
LENSEKRRDGCEGRGSGSDNALRLELDQIVGGKLLAVNGIFAMLGNVCLNEALFKYAAYFIMRLMSCAQGDFDLPLLVETTGT